jgi:hypothetical protein
VFDNRGRPLEKFDKIRIVETPKANPITLVHCPKTCINYPTQWSNSNRESGLSLFVWGRRRLRNWRLFTNYGSTWHWIYIVIYLHWNSSCPLFPFASLPPAFTYESSVNVARVSNYHNRRGYAFLPPQKLIWKILSGTWRMSEFEWVFWPWRGFVRAIYVVHTRHNSNSE